MTPPDDQQPLDDVTRAFLSATLTKLPEAVSQAMLADASVRAGLGLPEGDYVRLFDLRFDRADLFRCLRDVANDRPAPLVSHDGSLAIDHAELDDQGAALLLSCDHGARFANAGMLSDDLARRMQTLEALLARGELSAEREGQWRAALELGPLDNALFIALEETIEAIPEAFYRGLEARAGEGLAFDALVPDEEIVFAGLLGLLPLPPALGVFESDWAAAAAGLDSVRLARLLRLSAPLAVLQTGLIADLSLGLEADDRLALARFLGGAPDPFSVLAALEIAIAFRGEPDFAALAAELLARLVDPEESRLAAGTSLLCSTLIVTMALSARRGTLTGWPVYARRLGWFLHASHLVRTFGEGAVDPGELAQAVAPMVPGTRLADLCDAAVSPYNLASPLTPQHVHAVLLRRANQALARIPDDERPDAWAALVNDATKRMLESPAAVLLIAPAPFDPFEPDWTGLAMLPRDAVDDTIAAIDAGEDHDRITSDLFKMALAIEVEPDQRDAIAERLPKLLKAREGRDFLVLGEIAIQLAARWRNLSLSNAVMELVLNRAADPGLADPGVAPRFVLLAAACLEDRVEWAKRGGETAMGFAYALKPGVPSINLRNALGLMRDFSAALRAPLASAHSYCVLTFDRVAARDADEAPENEAA